MNQYRIKELEKENAELRLKLSEITTRLESRQAIEKSESLATLTGGIAHHFNNILFGISGNIELIKMNCRKQTDMTRYLARILEASKKIANLNARLTAYAGGGKYNPQMIVLSKYIKNALEQHNHHIFTKGAIINTTLQEHHLGIMVDLYQMNLVFSALLSNAADAVEKKGEIFIETGKLEINEIELPCMNNMPGVYSYLRVRDTGAGMDKYTRQRIFEPFFTTKPHGNGLDMPAVYGIVKSHDGWIVVESEKGEGTTVTIAFPGICLEKTNTACD